MVNPGGASRSGRVGPSGGAGGAGEVLVEVVRVGSVLKATAIDPVTLTEVSTMGPVNGSRELLTRTVVAKLAWVLKRNQEQGQGR